ncbi:unnamed protein product [Rotaria sordida]|nr:unnamed protein product [Rotaria sordida]CAF4152655.1 unnamed protein product [Rotaria sordida]CAF4196095.1 unnamed protein product [Rotaria sordida]
MVIPILCFARRLHNVLTVTFISEIIDGYFNDEDTDDIPDKLGQDDILGDEFITMAAKKILLSISYTKTLVRYVKQTNLNELIVKFGGDGTKTLKQSVITRWLSLFICVESVYSNYDATLLALESRRATKYMNDLTKYSLIDLLLLLAPINAALQAIQTDETPSLHLLFEISCISKKKYPAIFLNSYVAEYLSTEPRGVEFFRERIHLELNKIIFDDHHYMSMCLHPAFRDMEEYTASSAHQHELNIDQDDIEVYSRSDIGLSSSQSSLSTEFSYRTNYRASKPDELDRYLESNLSSTVVKSNLLEFWASDIATAQFPKLKRIARRLHSIPATSAGTERLFSHSGLILTSRRQRLAPSQVDNMLLIKSARQLLLNLNKDSSTNN